MGSNADLPAASAPQLILTNPTPEERRRTWRLTHSMWGKALPLETYLDREAYLINVPLAMDRGMTHWILTDGTLPPNERPLLSSCESIRKPAIATWPPAKEAGAGAGAGAGPDLTDPAAIKAAADKIVVVDGVAHGIASVYTDPTYRGHGYAGRMLRELGQRLKTWQVDDVKTEEEKAGKAGKEPTTSAVSLAVGSYEKTSLFSVLYSDIGRTFYASKGWPVFPSTHLAFKPAATSDMAYPADPAVAPLGYHELAELCAIDEQLLRARMQRKAVRRGAGAGPCAAIVPNLPTMLWHLMREDYMTKHIFQKTPTVRGAVATVSDHDNPHAKGHRVWAIWTRGYYDEPAVTEKNTLHILRVVLEDVYDDDADADATDTTASEITPAHVAAFRAILHLAQAEAAAWQCGTIVLWNPAPAISALAHGSGIPHELVDRERDSIASLMWNGAEPTESVEWVANEKYGWC